MGDDRELFPEMTANRLVYSWIRIQGVIVIILS